MKKREFDEIISSSGEEMNDAGELAAIYQMICDLPDPEPPASMDEKFFKALDKEGRKRRMGFLRLQGSLTGDPINLGRSLRVAAGIALFLMGWFGASLVGGGNKSEKQYAQLSDELGSLRESLILTMLQMNSPADRIQAVSMVGDISEVDERITVSLLTVLNNDPNENVRMVALETLLGYSEYPGVREGLIRSISQQESPLIQLRLAESMSMLGEKRSADEFRKLLNDLTIDYNIRTRIGETIGSLL